MKPRDTLLGQFDTLPDLRVIMEHGSDKQKKDARKKVLELLALEPFVDDIEASMEDQRRTREELSVTKELRPITDRNRENYMAGLAHIIPFFAMRAFSLPLDYREFKEKRWTNEMYHDFIDAIVIQPEYLSDEFLVSLGFMTEAERKGFSVREKIEKKIQLIPNIKILLHTLAPLRIGEGKTTGRISRVSDPNHPNFGGYIVFQELSEIEEDRETKRRNMRRKVVPHFFQDHYSLIRSQRYTTLGLRKKIEFLTELRDDIIPAMLIRWQRNDYNEELKRQEVATLVVDLEGSLAYNERRALEDRIKKIDYQNPENDRARLIGACNDIIKAISDKLGKQNEISAQTEWLRDSERQVRSAFELFYEESMLQIPALNQVLQGVEPQEMSPKENLKGNQTHKINAYLNIIQRYQERLSVLPEIGNPYHRLPGLIGGFLESMNLHRKERNGAIGKEGIRLLLLLILELKKIRFNVMMKESEYRVKVRGVGMTAGERQNLLSKILRVKDSLEGIRFLPTITLKEAGQNEFEEMIRLLTEVVEQIQGASTA